MSEVNRKGGKVSVSKKKKKLQSVESHSTSGREKEIKKKRMLKWMMLKFSK